MYFWKDGVTSVVQCKSRVSAKVGALDCRNFPGSMAAIPDFKWEAQAGRGKGGGSRRVGYMVTNQAFTGPAIKFAEEFNRNMAHHLALFSKAELADLLTKHYTALQRDVFSPSLLSS